MSRMIDETELLMRRGDTTSGCSREKVNAESLTAGLHRFMSLYMVAASTLLMMMIMYFKDNTAMSGLVALIGAVVTVMIIESKRSGDRYE